MRSAFRDINGLADLSEVVEAWSAFADAAVQVAAESAQQIMYTRYGIPRDALNQHPQKLIVVGMGKLGGRELNVSSDIDLVLCYPDTGETDGALKIENREFFAQVAKNLYRILDDRTEEGFVFRVDTRLRPDGASGPQTISLPALEEYLLVRGRPWERHAWLKARALGEGNDRLMTQLVEPFVYSRYLDYGAIASLRELHARMLRDDSRRDRERDIKIGVGGIREIEFTVQLFQLIRGGQDVGLRSRSTRMALQALADRGILEADIAQEMSETYAFLRRLEHHIQYLDDAQTHRLPLPGPDLEVLAAQLGFSDGAALEDQVTRLRQRVSESFARCLGNVLPKTTRSFSDPAHIPAEGPALIVEEIWGALIHQDAERLQESLQALAGKEGERSQPFLEDLLRGRAWRSISETGRHRLGRLVQNALTLAAERPPFLLTLKGMLDVFNAIGGRETYFALLDAYPLALQRLAELCAASAWLAALLARHPSLLDELIQLHTLADHVGYSEIQLEMNRTVLPYRQDKEAHMENLRQLKQRFVFRLAVLEIKNLITVQVLSDRLSELADACIHETLCVAAGGEEGFHGFAVIAFGKLGGQEMGYRSDLDLVFVYDSEQMEGEQAARLAKKVLTGLTSVSGAGVLYETDLRLRPDGVSGFLVTSLKAMHDYEHQRALTWEHQALSRARWCAGDPELGKRFEGLRREILSKPRDPVRLAEEIVEMRARMHKEHDVKILGWDIKRSEGGLVDIEFIVQFCVLAYSSIWPDLLDNKGNSALLRDAGAKNLAPQALCEAVAEAYLRLRALQHGLQLREQADDSLTREDAEPGPSQVQALWQHLFGVRGRDTSA